jgi:hypothetical protein
MVRVRTFAAFRHWLLNYFADDFAPSVSLRTEFVKAINAFGKDARVRVSKRDTRIISELKRCWRRVCSIYWDGHGRKSSSAGVEAEITSGGPEPELLPVEEPVSRNRVPSLILRATKKREEQLGLATSKSHPELRRRFTETPRGDAINSIRRAHMRTQSASSVQSPPESRTRHRRNLSDDSPILYSKNTDPSLFHSFARGDGLEEWPPVSVRTDLLVPIPTGPSTLPSIHRQKRRFFRSKRKKIAAEGALPSPMMPKAPLSLRISCTGDLSDEEDVSRPVRNTVPAISNRDRVDFLAAGMWPNFISASSLDDRRAEELGEALVQGYLPSETVDDDGGLDVVLDDREGDEFNVPSSGDEVGQTTLSMTEIERRMGLRLSRPPSMPLPQTPDTFAHRRGSMQYSERSITLSPPAPTIAPLPVHALRRRAGGDLRQYDATRNLRPRPETARSITSSMSSFSVVVDHRLEIPSVSIESRSLRSLLGIPKDERSSTSPVHRNSGLAMDFSQFRPPTDIESSDDDDLDGISAVDKALLKLEGKYVRKNRRKLQVSNPDMNEVSAPEEGGMSNYRSSGKSLTPPEESKIERSPQDLWRRRHRHVLDGQEFGSPSKHDPFDESPLYERFQDRDPEQMGSDPERISVLQEPEVQDLYIEVPTLESAIAELERNQLDNPLPRIPSMSPPQPPAESRQHSLSSHLPFILQYDSSVLARQFTLIEKDISAEIDWTELIEPTWMDHTQEMVDVRDWKGFITRDEPESGLHSVIAHFNLVPTRLATLTVDGGMDHIRSDSNAIGRGTCHGDFEVHPCCRGMSSSE